MLMTSTILSYIFHPVIIYIRIWRLSYLPLIYLFNLPVNNHDNYANSHMLSFIYSIIITCITPYTFYLVYNNYWLITQINSWVSEFVYNISLSYFISDLTIGLQYYPSILNSNILTSYVHHGVYISLLSYGKYYNIKHLFLFGLPYEIPTILLNLRNLDPAIKNNKVYNKLFGLLFFIFRILYNIFILYKTWMVHNDMFIFGVCTFILHAYWFINYANKYLL